jgi:hypothetical protein
MGDVALDVLKFSLDGMLSNLSWLNRSFGRCVKIGIKDEYTEGEFDQFENLISRFARTVDFLINKMFTGIDAVEFLDGGSIIDAVNRAEKRGIISSVSELRALKDLRDGVVNECEADNLKPLFSAVLDSIPRVFKIAEGVINYCKQYFAPKEAQN